MAKELILTGAKAINLLKHSTFPSENIFRAKFYDGNDEGREDEIIRFSDGFIFTKRQRYSFEKLRSDDIEIIFPEETSELLNLIKQSTPEAERIIHNLDLQIKKLGCPVNLKDTKIDEKKLLVKLHNPDWIPSPFERSKIYQVAQKSGKYAWWTPYFDRWLKHVESNGMPEPRGRLHLAYLFRHSGRLQSAISVTNVVEFSRHHFHCPDEYMSLLCTLRGATFLDIFDLHNDADILKITRKTLNKAYAIKQVEEVRQVYRRLSKAESYVSDLNYKTKLNEAYAHWKSWIS